MVGVCMLAVSGEASAAPRTLSTTETSTERVSYADLDLLGQAGKATLQRRIRAAAHRVCDTYGVQPLAVKLNEMRCNRSAIAHAAAQLDRIAAVHSAKAVEIAALAVDGATDGKLSSDMAYGLRAVCGACMVRLTPLSSSRGQGHFSAHPDDRRRSPPSGDGGDLSGPTRLSRRARPDR